METKEITFPVRVPSSVTVRLGIKEFTVTGKKDLFSYSHRVIFPLLCGSADRSAITGKSQMPGINQAFANGLRNCC